MSEDSLSMLVDRLSWIIKRVEKIDDEAVREFLKDIIRFEYQQKDSGGRYSDYYNRQLDKMVMKYLTDEGDIT